MLVTFLNSWRETISVRQNSRSPSGTARMMPSIWSAASSTRSEWTRSGWPPRVRNCLGTWLPMRSPRPAAGTRATVRLPTRDLELLGLFLESCEDHPARGRLQHTGHDHVHVPPDTALGVVHDDHCPVVEVGHPLAGFLPLFQNKHADGLAMQHDGPTRGTQPIEVHGPTIPALAPR